jgi:cell division protein FtsB
VEAHVALSPAIRKFLRIPFIILLLALLSGIWLWFGEGGFVRLYHSETERQECIERIRRLAAENETLLREIHLLRTDLDHLESVARRNLNLIKENEVVYRFDTEDLSRKPLEDTQPVAGSMDRDDGN